MSEDNNNNKAVQEDLKRFSALELKHWQVASSLEQLGEDIMQHYPCTAQVLEELSVAVQVVLDDVDKEITEGEPEPETDKALLEVLVERLTVLKEKFA